MGRGIIVCGLNGSGKSTLGRALAGRLGYHFIDIEDLYFPKISSCYPYDSPRSHEEVARLLLDELSRHENFVLAAVKGDFGEQVCRSFSLAVLISVPKDIRLKRVRARSYEKFGARMLPGGDLYEPEKRFFDLVASRPEDTVEKWSSCLACPILRVDGTRPVGNNVGEIVEYCRGCLNSWIYCNFIFVFPTS